MKEVISASFLAMLEARELHIDGAMNGRFGGSRKSRAYGSSPEFADFREYAPGDDLRRIDWNLYARFEKLIVKLFVDERQLHHRIYLDASASMAWGEPEKSAAALQLAAALGYLSVKALDRVSFYALEGKNCRALCPTVTNRDGFYAAIPALNALEFDGEVKMDEAIATHRDAGGSDGLSIIFSDFFSDDDWKRAVDALIAKGRRVLLVQVLSRDEIEPEMNGKVQLIDTEALDPEDPRNGRWEMTRSTLKAYHAALEWHQNELKSFCTARGASFFSLSSDESMERVLFEKGWEVGLVQ
ncbi:MAG: DUF58 domain-containing protein [Clostridia bacterium]|nr:DUF58 domain-containing protein [Clostridia bacterium]